MRTFLLAAISLLLLISASYAGWWYYVAQLVEERISQMPHITSGAISGFPGEITITGSVKAPYIVNGLPQDVMVPAFTLRTYPFYKAQTTLILPQGAYISGLEDRDIWSVDYLEIQGPLPLDLPTPINSGTLTEWRNGGGHITISHFALKKRELNAEGAGTFTLDGSLQPEGQINARIKGHLEYIRFMVEKNLIDSKGAMLASTILGGLSNPDENSGDHHMDIGIHLKNRTLYAGPLAVAQVPTIDWDSGNQPVSHQLSDGGLPASAQTYPAEPGHLPNE